MGTRWCRSGDASECSRARTGARGASGRSHQDEPRLRLGSFQTLASEQQQTSSARATNAPAIPMHLVAGFGVLPPLPSSPIGFRDIAADAYGLEVDERLICCDTPCRPPLGGRRHRAAPSRSVRPLQSAFRCSSWCLLRQRPACHADDRPGLERRSHARLCGQVRPRILQLGDLRVGIMRVGPIVVRPLLLPLAIDTCQVGTRRRLDACASLVKKHILTFRKAPQ